MNHNSRRRFVRHTVSAGMVAGAFGPFASRSAGSVDSVSM